MSKVNVLISTMYRDNLSFLKEMNVYEDAIVVNQTTKDNVIKLETENVNSIRVINSSKRGVSNSRNMLIEHTNSEISVFADDDIQFVDDFRSIIENAYAQNEDADLIVFQVPRVGKNSTTRSKTYSNKKKKINFLTSMKISAVEITFKTSSIKNKGIRFNPTIGTGTEFSSGEENQFLFDCLKAGLNILYLPIVTATVDVSNSTWFKGYDEDYFISTGAKFYNMTKKYYIVLILQFAIRKRKLYAANFNIFEVTKLMFNGVKKYKDKYE